MRLPPSYATLVAGWGVTCGYECARVHADYYPARAAQYGRALASLIELGHNVSASDYARLEAVRIQFARELEVMFDDIDALIAPCMPTQVPTAAAMEQPVTTAEGVAEFITFTAPFNYSGHPSLTLPAGSAGGLPLAFQLIGPLRGETRLLQIGQAYEQARGPIDYPLSF